jgi:hypothetical protein
MAEDETLSIIFRPLQAVVVSNWSNPERGLSEYRVSTLCAKVNRNKETSIDILTAS